MNVFLLIEELDQDEFKSQSGWKAAPLSTVVGVYSEREKAEREKETYELQSKEDIEKNNCAPCTYIIEERPIL